VADAGPDALPVAEVCERCGVAALTERNCKVICLNCGTIVKSCADLHLDR
jgi:hypothetical protein